MSQTTNIHSDLVWYKRIALEILWCVCYLLGCTPRWFRFGVMMPFFSCLLRLVGYRKKVVIKNLTNSFPEKSEAEIQALARNFYDTLAEVVVTTICLAAASPKQANEIMEWIDYEGHIERNKGRDWIAMAAHFGCWEYYPLWSWLDKECAFMSVYHTLRSDVFEHFYRRMRSRLAPNISIVPMKDTLRHYIRNRSKEHTTIIGLISDQSPILRADSQWIDFLNQKTTFIEGGERIAMKFGIPVYFVDAVRRKPGDYRIQLIELYDGKESVEEGEITRRYAEALEKMIRRSPELWMWSHRRWKHSPEIQLKRFGTTTLTEN